MSNSPVPKRKDLAQILLSFNARLRRIEVNRQNGEPAGSSFPDFTGTGTPQGHQVATAVGQWYEDTATGALYNFQGTPSTSNGWVQCAGTVGGGFGINDPFGNGIELHEAGGGGVSLVSDGGGGFSLICDGNITVTETGGSNISINTGSNDLRISLAGGHLRIDLPTSVAGLPTGALWNNAGVVNVAP